MGKLKTSWRSIAGGVLLALAVSICLFFLTAPDTAEAEHGDVVINRVADTVGIRPVIFPHWFHRIRFRCRVCHTELGFIIKAGANEITMEKILDGEYCGACHNGKIAWGPENCDMCHSAIPGTEPGVRGSHKTTGPGKW